MLTKFVDTDSDFNLEVAAEYGYKLVSMPYSIDGKTIYPYEDFTHFAHAYPNHYVKQRYLPPDLPDGTSYYKPGDNKTEQAAAAYWANVKK